MVKMRDEYALDDDVRNNGEADDTRHDGKRRVEHAHRKDHTPNDKGDGIRDEIPNGHHIPTRYKDGNDNDECDGLTNTQHQT